MAKKENTEKVTFKDYIKMSPEERESVYNKEEDTEDDTDE